MEILKWINENKETIGWIAGSTVATYKFGVFFYKKIWKPLSGLFAKLNYEMNNNGGKSIKDLIENVNETIIRIAAMNDAMLSVSNECIFKCSPDGKCTFANDSLCDLYGATNEEMMGYGWLNFLEPSERDQNQKNWEMAVANDSSISSEYTVINANTGQKINCFYKAAIKRNKEGKVISILGIVHRK